MKHVDQNYQGLGGKKSVQRKVLLFHFWGIQLSWIGFATLLFFLLCLVLCYSNQKLFLDEILCAAFIINALLFFKRAKESGLIKNID